jgi:hypothetical protein
LLILFSLQAALLLLNDLVQLLLRDLVILIRAVE